VSKKRTPKQLRRKAKKEAKRLEREAQMAEYLLGKGWKCCGPMKDVWKIDHWNIEKYSTEECTMSLHQAHKAQLKLDAMGYERPKSADDDLADFI